MRTRKPRYTATEGAHNPYSRARINAYHERFVNQRRKTIAKRSAVGVAVCVVAGLLLAFGLWIARIQSQLNNGAVVTDKLREVLVERNAPKDPYYVLLMGTDGRPGETSYRADSIILARIEPANKKVTLLSIPRDTKIEYRGSTIKLNGVHTYAGAAGMVEKINELCGIKIAHYAEVNFDGLSGITDALGGVEVDVDRDMKDTKNFVGVTELKAGTQKLNGAQALFYVRCRNFPDGDYSRMNHQRTFVKAVLKQVLQTRDPGSIAAAIEACSQMVITDMSITEIVSAATELAGINTETDLYTAYVPSEPKMINGQSFLVMDTDKFKEMMRVIDSGGNPAELIPENYGSAPKKTTSQ